MPKMNGREFLKKIKNTQGLMEIPVLIYTTSSDAKDKTDLILLGANKVITKPNSIPDLVLILKKELGKM
jgi:CheY-like chemotaxis protein